MTDWIKTVDIKQHLEPCRDMGHVPDEMAITCGKAIATLLETELPEYRMAPEFALTETSSHFNSLLEDLYDWADANKVWLGL